MEPDHYNILLNKVDVEQNGLKKDVSYFHDGTKNGGYIVPVFDDIITYITDWRIPYVLVFKKE